MLIILRIAELLVPIAISIWMSGYKSRNILDYFKLIQVERNESYCILKLIFILVSIYVSLFFTLLVLCGILIKDQIPKKLVVIGSIVQVVLSVFSSYFLVQFHNDLGNFNLILSSSAFALNALLFTVDGIIICQQIIFSHSK